MAIEERDFPSLSDAARALAEDMASALRQAVLRRGRALLALSGGRTPGLVFEALCALEVDWGRVTMTLTDERWCPPNHPDSNERLVRAHFLLGAAGNARFIPLYGGEESPELGIAACEARLEALELPFDVVYLGMGADGHFASLFPGDRAVDARTGRCVAIARSADRQARMSLTAPTLLSARRIFLLFSGAEKRATYSRARTPGSHREIPLRLVLSSEKLPVSVLSAP